MLTRRSFFCGGAGLAAAATVARSALAALPEIVTSDSPRMQVPPAPPNGRPFHPVATLNGWSLPWRMRGGVKEFHLVAEPVIREIAPGMQANLWGYNGQSPGPTLEVVEGDRVRIFVTNRLTERTSIHWHGQRLPNGMDGVTGLNQPSIKAGQTYVYEFTAQRAGTFMYHPHADETTQMAMGMMGFWVTHAADPSFMRVDRDYVLLLNAYDIDPGTYTPKVSTMLDFNLWTFNSRAFPGTDPMVARLGERVRIRVGNLSMTNHPIHLHGHEFEVVGTDGGWTPPAARWPEVTTDIAVGQMRAIEFTASAPGDWAFHCHKSHHTMNAMGHSVPTTLGVEQADLAKQIAALVPDYMPMDSGSMGDMPMDSGSMGDMAMDAGSMGDMAMDAGSMGDMAKHGGSTGDVAKDGGSMGDMAMSMPLPDNTLPMMTGTGPHGGIEMGGMFTVMKIRAELAAHDYRDPGWYRAPAGSVAYPWAGETPPLRRGG